VGQVIDYYSQRLGQGGGRHPGGGFTSGAVSFLQSVETCQSRFAVPIWHCQPARHQLSWRQQYYTQ